MSQSSFLIPIRECISSDWYAFPEDHRCPHDAWVEAVTISEPASGERHQARELQIHIRLLGAYHDGIIEFTYSGVQNYSVVGSMIAGHRDWLRDEIEDRDGIMRHSIQLVNGKFQIEAQNIEYKWTPLSN
jgi:hypothetical protein